MNRSTPIAAPTDHAPGYRAIRFNLDWITRPLFGCALAAVAIAAVFAGVAYVAGMAAIAAVAAAREWHRLVGETVFGAAFFVTAIFVMAALGVQLIWPHQLFGLGVLFLGAFGAAAVASARRSSPLWHGLGAVYLGIPALSLVTLREVDHGAWVIVGLFIAIWATDTGALFIGNLVGGRRLWPALSPNKTWSGTLGGIVAGAGAEAGFIAALGGHALPAALYGATIAIAAIAGDLFESFVKRVFQRKDSGAMIPGHGGVLDRIDSTLSSAPLAAIAVLGFGLTALFGANP